MWNTLSISALSDAFLLLAFIHILSMLTSLLFAGSPLSTPYLLSKHLYLVSLSYRLWPRFFSPFLFSFDETLSMGGHECPSHTKVSRCTMWRRAGCLLICIE
ncbi:hypothetical protein C8R44DRAFT_756855 [Mycena epipterygia]|nr:hypothetical protein C8R44DRAFT_756855 [Mycena epipterygia]